MSAERTNGVTHSAFIKHLLNYPIISDGVTSFKRNTLGQTSIKITDSAYSMFVKPVGSLLARPYQYVAPYVKRADDIGDKTLNRVDERFPIVRKPTGELYQGAKDIVLFPLSKSIEGKEHIKSTYFAELRKMNKKGNKGVKPAGKAIITTFLVYTTEFLTVLSEYLSGKTQEAKEVVNEKMNNNNNRARA